jgi:hypothetical protein
VIEEHSSVELIGNVTKGACFCNGIGHFKPERVIDAAMYVSENY